MRYAIVVACVGTLLVPLSSVQAVAQSTPKRSAEEIRKLVDAHQGDFDYLLGDWEFTAESREYGTFHGLWSAVRLEKGHILDEYRVVGDNGETYYVTTTLRNYNAVLDQWELVGLDAGSGLQDKGSGRRMGSEMHIEQTFGYVDGKPSLWKIRYYDIRPDQFSWSADRSTDSGKTWVTKHQTIQARRIGPSRTLAPLTSPKKSSQAAPATADPITGNWGSDGVTFLELKLEPNNLVSGTAIWRDGPTRESRAPIKTGSFDPKTGAVKLQGDAKRPDNGATVPYVIEGKLDKETLAGTFALDDRNGNFTFTRK